MEWKYSIRRGPSVYPRQLHFHRHHHHQHHPQLQHHHHHHTLSIVENLFSSHKPHCPFTNLTDIQIRWPSAYIINLLKHTCKAAPGYRRRSKKDQSPFPKPRKHVKFRGWQMRQRSATAVAIRTLVRTYSPCICRLYHTSYFIRLGSSLPPSVLPVRTRPCCSPEVGAICFCSVDPLLSPTVQPTCLYSTTLSNPHARALLHSTALSTPHAPEACTSHHQRTSLQ